MGVPGETGDVGGHGGTGEMGDAWGGEWWPGLSDTHGAGAGGMPGGTHGCRRPGGSGSDLGTPPPAPLQASQVNDANKYAVTQAVVRVLAANRHPPRFAHPTYRAFVPAGAREAALLLTFGGHVLALRAHDPDFPEVRAGGAGRGTGEDAGRDAGMGCRQRVRAGMRVGVQVRMQAGAQADVGKGCGQGAQAGCCHPMSHPHRPPAGSEPPGAVQPAPQCQPQPALPGDAQRATGGPC